jgi:hypothetical protein
VHDDLVVDAPERLRLVDELVEQPAGLAVDHGPERLPAGVPLLGDRSALHGLVLAVDIVPGTEGVREP